MAVSGFTWYQGESDLGGNPNAPWPNKNYSCTQTAMYAPLTTAATTAAAAATATTQMQREEGGRGVL